MTQGNANHRLQAEIKPFLRWAGSKRKLIPKLIQYWDDEYSRYVEPFMGSSCLFFAISPKRALLNDLNKELVDTYRAIKSNPLQVFNQLKKLKLGKEQYYKLRAIQPNVLNQFELAARFIFLNRYCFNGLYRTNEKGHFNVPHASSGTGSLPTKQELIGISDLLYRKRLESYDFEKILNEYVSEGDFVYLDPPYAVSNRRIFRQYGKDTFGIEDLKRLKQALVRLDKRNIPFLLSYAYCKEALDVFDKWPCRKVYTQRNIAGFASKRKRAAEVLITNIE